MLKKLIEIFSKQTLPTSLTQKNRQRFDSIISDSRHNSHTARRVSLRAKQNHTNSHAPCDEQNGIIMNDFFYCWSERDTQTSDHHPESLARTPAIGGKRSKIAIRQMSILQVSGNRKFLQ